jgi:AmpD protein
VSRFGPLDEAGWLAGARHQPSRHCDARPGGIEPELAILHNISLPPGEFGGGHVAELFLGRLDPGAHPYFATLEGLRVSAHFLIERDGRVTQFVPCALRAWHAGVSSFRGRARCNDWSIGIELEGTDFTPFEPAQYAALGALLERLAARYPLRHVAGHSDVAAGRKTDPGPEFDWRLLRSVLAARGAALERPA